MPKMFSCQALLSKDQLIYVKGEQKFEFTVLVFEIKYIEDHTFLAETFVILRRS